MDDACIDGNKDKDKGQRDEAEHKEGPLCVSKAKLGAELIISDGCWAVDNLDDRTAGKGEDECGLQEQGTVITMGSPNLLSTCMLALKARPRAHL